MFEDVEPNSDRWFDLKDLLNEEWKDIPNFENMYQVSNYSRIKSLYKPFNHNQFMYDRIMKIKPNRNGYSSIHFRCYGKEYRKLLHVLVAELFIPNPNNKPLVLHKKSLSSGGTNRVDNLYWGNQKDNMDDRRRENHFIVSDETKRKISKASSIKTNQYDLNGKYIKTWNSAVEAANTLNIDSSTICKCRNGYKKQCGGYQWKIYNNSIDDILPYERRKNGKNMGIFGG